MRLLAAPTRTIVFRLQFRQDVSPLYAPSHSLRLATNCHPQALKAALASERDAAAANQAAVAEGRRRVASLKEEQEKLKVRVACVAGCLRGCACTRLLV